MIAVFDRRFAQTWNLWILSRWGFLFLVQALMFSTVVPSLSVAHLSMKQNIDRPTVLVQSLVPQLFFVSRCWEWERDLRVRKVQVDIARWHVADPEEIRRRDWLAIEGDHRWLHQHDFVPFVSAFVFWKKHERERAMRWVEEEIVVARTDRLVDVVRGRLTEIVWCWINLPAIQSRRRCPYSSGIGTRVDRLARDRHRSGQKRADLYRLFGIEDIVCTTCHWAVSNHAETSGRTYWSRLENGKYARSRIYKDKAYILVAGLWEHWMYGWDVDGDTF